MAFRNPFQQAPTAALPPLAFCCTVLSAVSANRPNASCHSSPVPQALIADLYMTESGPLRSSDPSLLSYALGPPGEEAQTSSESPASLPSQNAALPERSPRGTVLSTIWPIAPMPTATRILTRKR